MLACADCGADAGLVEASTPFGAASFQDRIRPTLRSWTGSISSHRAWLASPSTVPRPDVFGEVRARLGNAMIRGSGRTANGPAEARALLRSAR
jgi:hypothetical protein